MSAAKLSPVQARAAVERMVKMSDRVGHMAARMYPHKLRPHYRALKAFDMELLALRALPDPEVSVKRIAQWKEVVHNIFAASRGSTAAPPPPANPVALALASAVLDPRVQSNGVGGLQESRFLALLDAREQQLDPIPPMTIQDAERMGELTYGQLYRLSLDLLGIRSYPNEPETIGPAERLMLQLGKAAGLTHILALSPPSAVGAPVTPHKPSAFLGPQELGSRSVGDAQDRRGLPIRILIPQELFVREALTPELVMLYFNPSVQSTRSFHNPRATQDYVIQIHIEEAAYTLAMRGRDHLKDARASWKSLKRGAPVPASQLHAGDAALAGPAAELAKQALARDQEEAAAMQPIKLASSELKALRGPLSEGAFFAHYLSAVQNKAYFSLRETVLERHRLGKALGLRARMAWMRWTGRF